MTHPLFIAIVASRPLTAGETSVVLGLGIVFAIASVIHFIRRHWYDLSTFFARRIFYYKTAAALALVSSLSIVVASDLLGVRVVIWDFTAGRFGFYLVAVPILAVVLLPVLFVAILCIVLLVRIFVLPILEFGGFVAGLCHRTFSSLFLPQPPPGPTWEERERERLAGEHARLAEKERLAVLERSIRRRREDARARCEMFFTLYALELGARFTHEMFTDYLRRHMGDEREPEIVEQRGEALLTLLQQQLEMVKPEPKFRGLKDIARWFEEQKRQIDTVPDERLRQTLLATLKARYAELSTQFLEEMQA